jgi:hypothetical protein
MLTKLHKDMLQEIDRLKAAQEPVACKTLCELCLKRGYDFCANAAKTTPIPTPPAAAQPAQRQPLTDEDELSNGLAMALHDAVLIRIGKDDEATRQAIARIDKLVAKYKNEAAHGIKEKNT